MATTINPTPRDIGAKSVPSNLLSYAITTDGSMGPITEKVNGVTVWTKTATSGQALNVSLTDAQWDAVNFGKYHTASGTPNTLTIEMGTEKWTYTFTKTANENTTESQLAEALKDMNEVFLPGVKEKLAVPIRSKGGTVPANPSFDGLADAIAGIPLGKKSKIGTVLSSNNTSSFQYAIGTNLYTTYSISVTGLSFKPSLIFAISSDASLSVYSEINDSYYPITVKTAQFNGGRNDVVVTHNFKGDFLPAYVSSNSFLIPVIGANKIYTYIAIE